MWFESSQGHHHPTLVSQPPIGNRRVNRRCLRATQLSILLLRLISHIMLTNEKIKIGAPALGLFTVRRLFLTLPGSFFVSMRPFAGELAVFRFRS